MQAGGNRSRLLNVGRTNEGRHLGSGEADDD
jgi:hypothetical protein